MYTCVIINFVFVAVVNGFRRCRYQTRRSVVDIERRSRLMKSCTSSIWRRGENATRKAWRWYQYDDRQIVNPLIINGQRAHMVQEPRRARSSLWVIHLLRHHKGGGGSPRLGHAWWQGGDRRHWWRHQSFLDSFIFSYYFFRILMRSKRLWLLLDIKDVATNFYWGIAICTAFGGGPGTMLLNTGGWGQKSIMLEKAH